MLTKRHDHDQAERERLRYIITRAWRRNGRRGWTETDLQTAISEALPANRKTAEESPTNAATVQTTLFEADEATQRTRAAAYQASLPQESSRCDRVECWVANRGRYGALREEIAEGCGIPLQSVCSVVRKLIRSGRLVNTPRTRRTKTGSPAAVVVAARMDREATR